MKRSLSERYFLGKGAVGLDFAISDGVMPMMKDQAREGDVAVSGWQRRKDAPFRQETARFLSKVDFRRGSSHISQKKPGYYLILLRTELRHRSLRDKRSLAE